MKFKTLLGAALVALLCLGLLAGCGGSDDDSGGDSGGDGGSETLKLGFSGDFSGVLAAYDVPLRDGMEFAVKQINESGGDLQVELRTEDNKGDPQLTVTQTQELLDDNFEINVVGTGDGRNAAAALVGENNGLTIAGLNGYPNFLTEAGERSAHIVVTDNIQAAALAQFACDQGFKNIYAFASDDFGYTNDLPIYFGDAFAEFCGGKIVETGQFDLGQSDFSALVTKLKNFSPQPDAVYSPHLMPDAVSFIKQLRQAGIDLPYLGADSHYLADFVTSAGKAAEGAFVSPHTFPSEGSPLAKFQDEYRELMGSELQTPLFEAIGRDIVYGLVEAAGVAGSTGPDEVLASLGDVPPETYVTLIDSTWSEDFNGPETSAVSIVQVKNGDFEEVDVIRPEYVPRSTR